MPFNPEHALFPEPVLRHIFDRHKVDWGFESTATATRANLHVLLGTLQLFIRGDVIVYEGIYGRGHGSGPAYFVLARQASRVDSRGLIFHRGEPLDHYVWSGWKFGSEQVHHMSTAPHEIWSVPCITYDLPLGLHMLDVYGLQTEKLVTRMIKSVIDSYLPAYKADPFVHMWDTLKEPKFTYSEKEQQALEQFFTACDKYAAPKSNLHKGKLGLFYINNEQFREELSAVLGKLEKYQQGHTAVEEVEDDTEDEDEEQARTKMKSRRSR